MTSKTSSRFLIGKLKKTGLPAKVMILVVQELFKPLMVKFSGNF